MADIVTPAKRSEMMAGIKAKNTKPEIIVRRILHASGFRYRLHRNDLPGKPDIVLPKWKAVVFVHGCFWHGHADCIHYRPPKTRTEFWTTKIASNRERDSRNRHAVAQLGWRVATIWECAVLGRLALSTSEIAERLVTMLRGNSNELELRGYPQS